MARRRLERAGLRTLAANLRHPACELDLVLVDGDELVVCEVKTLRSRRDLRLGERRFRPADRVDAARVARLARAARDLARDRSLRPRVDVVEVWIAGPRRRPEFGWHRGVEGAPRWPGGAALPAASHPDRR